MSIYFAGESKKNLELPFIIEIKPYKTTPIALFIDIGKVLGYKKRFLFAVAQTRTYTIYSIYE